MQCITITFNQRDAAMLSQRFTMLQPHFKEVPSKKYAWPIQGLVSRSFEYSNGMLANWIKSLYFGKSCPLSCTVVSIFI